MYKYFFIILYFLIFLLILTIERKIFNSHISPLTFFCLLWCIVGIGANMALYDYYEPSVFINMIIITSIIIVFIFFLIIFVASSLPPSPVSSTTTSHFS